MKAPPRFVRSGEGFSLLEVLIVMGILILLTSMYWGRRTGPTKEQKLAGACSQNLQRLYLAMEIYSKDFGGKFPIVRAAKTSEEALSPLVPKYSVDTAIFVCAASSDFLLKAGEPLTNGKISYAYFMGRSATGEQQAREPLVSDRLAGVGAQTTGPVGFSSNGKPPGNNHKGTGGNFLFTDGSVEASAANVPFSLGLTQGVILLNPKP